MDEPISAEETWYVPTRTSVPSEVLNFFEINGIDMNPKKASNIIAGTEDIDQAKMKNFKEDYSWILVKSLVNIF